MTPAQLVTLRHMRRDGSSIRECASALGISRSMIHRYVRELGVLEKRLPLAQIAKSVKPYGFVYVFAAQSLVKIGMTMHSVNQRWYSIRTHNPWLEPALYASPPLSGDMPAVEKACHKALAAYHHSGEWFSCDRQLAVDTVIRVVKQFQEAK